MKFNKTFLQGLLVFLPVFLTFYVLYQVLKFIYKMMDFGVLLLPESYRSNALFAGPIVVITIILTIFFIAFIGMSAKTLFGRIFQKYLGTLLTSIPVVRSIYQTLRQFFNVLFVNSSKTFSKPVLVPFPFKGRNSIGFVTNEFKITAPDGTVERFARVFVPTVPNPTTGFTISYPAKDLIYPGITSDEALRLILSGGILHQ